MTLATFLIIASGAITGGSSVTALLLAWKSKRRRKAEAFARESAAIRATGQTKARQARLRDEYDQARHDQFAGAGIVKVKTGTTIPVDPRPFDPLDPNADKEWCIACDGITASEGFGLTRDQLHWFCADCRADYDDPEAVLNPRPAVVQQTKAAAGMDTPVPRSATGEVKAKKLSARQKQERLVAIRGDAPWALGKVEQKIVQAVGDAVAAEVAKQARNCFSVYEQLETAPVEPEKVTDGSGIATPDQCAHCHAKVWVLPSVAALGGAPLCQDCARHHRRGERPPNVVDLTDRRVEILEAQIEDLKAYNADMQDQMRKLAVTTTEIIQRSIHHG